MTYEEFLNMNRNKLIGYFMLGEISAKSDAIETPYPSEHLSDEQHDALKGSINECIPLDTMITDLWDWDIHLERDLSDDWYYEAVFGSAQSLETCADELAEFFIEKCNEYCMDYNQQGDDLFYGHVREQAANFILDWRRNLFARHAQSDASGTVLRPNSDRHGGYMMNPILKTLNDLMWVVESLACTYTGEARSELKNLCDNLGNDPTYAFDGREPLILKLREARDLSHVGSIECTARLSQVSRDLWELYGKQNHA